jgi:hypothetical protein
MLLYPYDNCTATLSMTGEYCKHMVNKVNYCRESDRRRPVIPLLPAERMPRQIMNSVGEAAAGVLAPGPGPYFKGVMI